MTTDTIIAASRRIVSNMSDSPTGEMQLRAVRIGGRTVAAQTYRTAPFHLGFPAGRTGDGTLNVVIQGVGPGYLPGDRLVTGITVEAGASLVVRGQGATKLYPSQGRLPVAVDVSLVVHEGGRLVYLPGALIPFRHAELEQVTRIEVARGGLLALGEIVTPGRVAMGEAWEFTRLRLDVEARFAGRTCLIERARIEPSRRPLHSVARHGPHPVAGTIFVIGDHADLPPVPPETGPVTWATASGDGYTLARFLGPTVQAVAAAMEDLLTFSHPFQSPPGGR